MYESQKLDVFPVLQSCGAGTCEWTCAQVCTAGSVGGLLCMNAASGIVWAVRKRGEVIGNGVKFRCFIFELSLEARRRVEAL